MAPHDLPLGRRERARLEQDGVRNPDLADVVQQHAVLEVAQRAIRHSVRARDGERIAAHPARVRVGADVPRVDRRPQGLQRRAVRVLEAAQRALEIPRRLRHPTLEQRLMLAALDQELAVVQRALRGMNQLGGVDGLEDEIVGAAR